jgi:predicted transcriptional regulator
MVTLSIDIPEEMNAQMQEICRRQNCTPDEALRELLRRWVAVEQFRKDANEVRQLAEAAGFASEKDIFEAIS